MKKSDFKSRLIIHSNNNDSLTKSSNHKGSNSNDSSKVKRSGKSHSVGKSSDGSKTKYSIDVVETKPFPKPKPPIKKNK